MAKDLAAAQEAASFPTDTEIVAMKPGEWLEKFVGADWTVAQLLAITSAQESWCNTFLGNGAAFTNTRPGGAPPEENGINLVVDIERGANDTEEYLRTQLNRICGTAADVKEVKMVSGGRLALITLQGPFATHATLLTRVEHFGGPSYKSTPSWTARFEDGGVVVALPPGISRHDATVRMLSAARELASKGADCMLSNRGQGADGGWNVAFSHPEAKEIFVALLADPATMGGEDKVLVATLGDPVDSGQGQDRAFGEMRYTILAPMGAPPCDESNASEELLASAHAVVHRRFHLQRDILPARDRRVAGCANGAEWIPNRSLPRATIRVQACSLTNVAPPKPIIILIPGSAYRVHLRAWTRAAPSTSGGSGGGGGSYAAAARTPAANPLTAAMIANIVATEVGNKLRQNADHLQRFGDNIAATVTANSDKNTARLEATIVETATVHNSSLKANMSALYNVIQGIPTMLKVPPAAWPP